MIGGLTQRVKDLEQKHSELESKNFSLLNFCFFFNTLLLYNYSPLSHSIDLEKIKEEVVAEKAKTALLEEEIKAKDQSFAKASSAKDRLIAEATTKYETLSKTNEGNMS